MADLAPATRPTLYFIGVTTGQSSIMRIFPAWAEALGLRDAAIRGIDFPLDAGPAAYREAVGFIKADPLSRGALVTTHKLNLFAACRDLFDELDPFSSLMNETSCLSKRDGRFISSAKDPISSGLAIEGFLGRGYFAETRAEVFCIGAGGSGVAITWRLMRAERGADLPARIVASDRSRSRLEHMADIHAKVPAGCPMEYVEAPDASANDAVLSGLKRGSLVINATGLGKDAPGSPLSDAAEFPERGIAWDLNYRGDLVFLDQARAQADERALRIVDGWTYFLHGWTQVIAEVFEVAIPTSGPAFDRLSEIAASGSGR